MWMLRDYEITESMTIGEDAANPKHLEITFRKVVQMKLLMEEVPKSPTCESTGPMHFFRETS